MALGFILHPRLALLSSHPGLKPPPLLLWDANRSCLGPQPPQPGPLLLQSSPGSGESLQGGEGSKHPAPWNSFPDWVIIVIKTESSVTAEQQLNYRSERRGKARIGLPDNQRWQMKLWAPIHCNCTPVWGQKGVEIFLKKKNKIMLQFNFTPFLIHSSKYKYFKLQRVIPL